MAGFGRAPGPSFAPVRARSSRLTLAATAGQTSRRHQAAYRAGARRLRWRGPGHQFTHPPQPLPLTLRRLADVAVGRVVLRDALLTPQLVALLAVAVPALRRRRSRRGISRRSIGTSVGGSTSRCDGKRRPPLSRSVSTGTGDTATPSAPTRREPQPGEAEDAREQADRHRAPAGLDARHGRRRHAEPCGQVALAEVGHPPHPHHEPSHLEVVVHACLPVLGARACPPLPTAPSPSLAHSPAHRSSGTDCSGRAQQRDPLLQGVEQWARGWTGSLAGEGSFARPGPEMDRPTGDSSLCGL